MNIIFWGSSDFSIPSIEALFNRYNINAVVTNPDSFSGRGLKELARNPVMAFALDKNIPVIAPVTLKDNNFFNELKKYDADLFSVVSYGMIIPENIINYPRYKSINLHGSLLPKYRGASPIQAALLNGDIETGVSLQFLSKEMDKGDIIFQENIKISPEDNYNTLSSKISVIGAEILMKSIEQIESGDIHATPQIENNATYTKLITKEDGRVSFFANTAIEIYNKWRAFYRWPGVFTEYRNSNGTYEINNAAEKGLDIKLTEISPPLDNSDVPGKIIRAERNGLIVSCRKGALKLIKLKPSGKKEMDQASFINGYRPIEGRYF